jgi:ATP-dependent exoDNAse (exonuclease V) beta subunit
MTRTPADQAARDRVVSDFDTILLLEAGAGTGKTTVLVSRILALVRTGRATLDRVVAITFTEKAAGELKLRLREGIEDALARTHNDAERQRLLAASADLERAPVSTIHAFAAALLRERPFEARLDPGFQVAAEIAGERVLDDAWDAWFDERMSEADATLVRALTLGLKLKDLKQAAVRMTHERDVLGAAVPRPPFTTTKLRDRVREAVATLQPLKARCTNTDDDAYQQILRLEAFLNRADKASGLALERLLRELWVVANKGQQGNWKPKEACKDVKAELKALKDAKDAYETASDADLAWALRHVLRGFLDAYEARKRERAVVDYADLLLKARDVLRKELPVRRYFQKRFDYILVDEFQDTDPLQAQIALLLAEDPTKNPPADDWRKVTIKPGKLFVVGDPKQSIYRFRRADIAIYEEVKALIERSGGEVLPLTANFRTVPSVLDFVNERFEHVFKEPEDPKPRPLEAFRPEVARDGARTIALPLPKDRLPEPKERKVGDVLPVLAQTIAAFIRDITRERPWSIRDRATDSVRPARPGDVGLLVRKMTPDFIGPFEDALEAQGIPYRLVGGKEYYAREEVQALTAVLRAIDNPADRLAVFAALRSPFFGLSDDDVFQFVASGGILNALAPIKDGTRNADLVGRAFAILQSLHRRRRVEPPSAVIQGLFEKTRALVAFRLRAAGDQSVANLWKVLDVARAYEAAGPATLRAVVRFLQEEAQAGREEGDSPVGEQAGAQIEVLTVYKAKGLEYPLVIVADLLVDRRPQSSVVVRHATGEGWLKIGSFKPAGWEEALKEEERQQDAEERRLLYVALTRARDHLVIPCFPDQRRKAWLDDAIAGFAVDNREPPLGAKATTVLPDGRNGAAAVTWFDTKALEFGGEATSRPKTASAIDGTDADARKALVQEDAWESARKTRRKAARQISQRVVAATDTTREEDKEVEAPTAQPTNETEAEIALDGTPRALEGPTPRSARFGKLVHALLGHATTSDADLDPIAQALAPQFGLPPEDAKAAATLVARARTLPEIAAAETADQVYRELPFAVPMPDGTLATGVIDLAYRKKGEWTVMDFKTAHLANAGRAREAHGGQMATYRRSLAALTGAPVHAVLCLLRSGDLLDLSDQGASEARVGPSLAASRVH